MGLELADALQSESTPLAARSVHLVLSSAGGADLGPGCLSGLRNKSCICNMNATVALMSEAHEQAQQT